MAGNEERKAQLQLDIDELKDLRTKAKRKSVLSLLSSGIREFESKLQKLENPNAVKYTSMGSSKFSWSQKNETITILLYEAPVDSEKVVCDIKPSSVDIKMHDVAGKNYRFTVPKLNKEIIPEKRKVVVDPKQTVEITLAKSSKGMWSDLRFKEDKTKVGQKRARK